MDLSAVSCYFVCNLLKGKIAGGGGWGGTGNLARFVTQKFSLFPDFQNLCSLDFSFLLESHRERDKYCSWQTFFT